MPRLHYRRFALGALGVVLAGCPVPVAASAPADADSIARRPMSLVALPYAFYTPETRFAFGAGSIGSFRGRGASAAARPSSVGLAVTYTQRKQVMVALQPEIYFLNEQYSLSAFYGYYKFPDKFWGIGNDTPAGAEEGYQSNDFRSLTVVGARVVRGLYAGVRYEYQHLSVTNEEPRGELRMGRVPGTAGGAVSGFGFAISHDTRDNVYQPTSGFYDQSYAVFFGPSLGSRYTFTSWTLDFRMYRTLFRSHVLALQTLDTFIWGEAPFQMLGMIGGSYQMRGYYLGRYRDRDMITAQAEYRFPVYWRFGGVAFAGAGQVAHDLAGLRFDELRSSLGFGLRFMLDTRERINARIDVGFGGHESAGVYARVNEAF